MLIYLDADRAIASRELKEELCRNALNIYKYGSTVYGTSVPGISDRDYIIIVPDNKYHIVGDLQFHLGDKEYTVYNESRWQAMLDAHEVCAMECYFLPQECIIREDKVFTTALNVAQLRESFSHVASNSWVKCKKKLTVPQDFAPRVGKKSLWHSLRILDFGIQIAKHGRIVDYTSMNYLYTEIVNNDIVDYNYFKSRYQKQYNALKSEFRRVAPLE